MCKPAFLGKLLLSQQEALKEGIGVSLPILDKIVENGVKFGAFGGKLTGAGLGGAVVLLVPEESKSIKEKLERQLKLPAWYVSVDEGVSFTRSNETLK